MPVSITLHFPDEDHKTAFVTEMMDGAGEDFCDFQLCEQEQDKWNNFQHRDGTAVRECTVFDVTVWFESDENEPVIHPAKTA